MLIPKGIESLETMVSKDSTRYATNGVLIERDGDGKARAVVTDGQRLMVAEFAEDDAADYPVVDGFDRARVNGFSAILPAGTLKSAVKNLPKYSGREGILKNLAVDEKSSNGQVTISTTDGSAVSQSTVTTIDGKFPPWRDIIPKYSPLTGDAQDKTKSIRIGINAKLLGGILAAFSKINKEHDNPDIVCLEVPLYDNRPIVISTDLPGIGKTTAILMPVNLEKLK